MTQAPPGVSRPVGGVQPSQLIAPLLQQPSFPTYINALSPEDQAYVFEQIVKELEAFIGDVLAASWDALGLVEARPEERLFFYMELKTPDMWAQQQAQFDDDYRKQLGDLERLSERYRSEPDFRLAVDELRNKYRIEQEIAVQQQAATVPQPVMQ